MPAPAVSAIDYDALIQRERIHASLYTDPRIFAEEMEKIFHRGWVFVGHESEVPGPGDFVTRDVGTQPVIMVRQENGTVAVLLNRCSHRGTMVCQPARGSARVFSCPYHGWTYDLSGRLLGVTYPGGYDGSFDRSSHALPRAPRSAGYRGFVFASFSSAGASLEEHLGAATRLIDRACDLSPEGGVELTAGWIRHRCSSNWKMLPENDIDGYHLGFVHRSLWKTVRTQYQRVVGAEESIKAVVRDWGNGHIEIDWAPGYQEPFEWLGGAAPELVARYVAAMESRWGVEPARQRVFDGPPHALIFPNLFLGETNIAIVQPLGVEECVHWHTPMFLKGVPEFNRRLLRQSEGAMGPASFLMPEDLTVASRNQVGLRARALEWLELSRGLNREHVDAEGRRVSHVTDETTNRAFWQHYRRLMSAA
ncbi:MAG TPA: Rieske 2Fe-2S domain-containing protein [Candidatus Methylomirabilis sp.]|nr:Rieske 2Fe-2S domain-containing protein [Candidatus Methylomirabilis sp.]